jgi:hypothetical protein
MRVVVVLAVGALAGMSGTAACGARTGLDAPAPVDASIPGIGAGSHPGPGLTDCPDAGDTLVYIVTDQATLYSFYPPTAAFTTIGTLACPTPDPTWQPFSMAVDHEGTAYVLYDDGTQSGIGQLYRVDTATAACTLLPYSGGQDGFDTFGMGFVGNADGTTDTLYIASDTTTSGGAPQLASLDLTRFQVAGVRTIAPGSVQNAELSGTGDGRLFAFYAIDQGSSSAVGQLDPTTGALIANDDLSNLPQVGPDGGGWAFAFWGGEFYLFTTGPNLGSVVTRFDPGDRSQVVVASLPQTIVGAGVSTCAPQ